MLKKTNVLYFAKICRDRDIEWIIYFHLRRTTKFIWEELLWSFNLQREWKAFKPEFLMC